MSLFEVKTTQNRGYVVDNSANGFKTSESLMNIPQSIFVVTRDMIDDTNTYNPTDTLRYAGVATQFSGAAFNLRGTRVNPLVDGMAGDPSADPINIDSYQLIKGPAAVFYHSASLGGTVLETTRKPHQQHPLGTIRRSGSTVRSASIASSLTRPDRFSPSAMPSSTTALIPPIRTGACTSST